jgi:hypothetical protein
MPPAGPFLLPNKRNGRKKIGKGAAAPLNPEAGACVGTSFDHPNPSAATGRTKTLNDRNPIYKPVNESPYIGSCACFGFEYHCGVAENKYSKSFSPVGGIFHG